MSNFPTIGIDKYNKPFRTSDGSSINCLIYDTCGQERYHSINESYYRNADVALLVYDISQRDSFMKLKEYYVPKIKDYCKENIIISLLGNKADLEERREVTTEEGVELALQEKYDFKESSCLHNKNVAGAFEELVERWNFENHEQRKSLDNLKEKDTKGKFDKKKTLDYTPTDNSRQSIVLKKKDHTKNKKNKCC